MARRLTACSDDATQAKHGAKTAPVKAPSKVDATDASPAQTEDWQTLITGVVAAPGTESYTCARNTMTEDLYVNGFEAINPQGTHHTLLTMGDADKPDGVIDCSVQELHPLERLRLRRRNGSAFSYPTASPCTSRKARSSCSTCTCSTPARQVITGTSGTRIRSDRGARRRAASPKAMLAGTINARSPARRRRRCTPAIAPCRGRDAVRGRTAHAPARHLRKGRRAERSTEGEP